LDRNSRRQYRQPFRHNLRERSEFYLRSAL
jgi:hypothetical protein